MRCVLHLVEKIVHEAACPVIALIHAPNPDFLKEASKRGVLPYITDADARDWQSSIDIVLRRFAECHDLEGAFGRRAITEPAQGILMERHSNCPRYVTCPSDGHVRAPLAVGATTLGRRVVHLVAPAASGSRPR